MMEIKAVNFLADRDQDNILGQVLSNHLLRDAKEAGLSVGTLAFPREEDFEEKLPSRRRAVEIVRVRNDLAHGNVLAFVNEDVPSLKQTFLLTRPSGSL